MNRHFNYIRRGIALVAMFMAVLLSASGHELRKLYVTVNLLDNGDAIITEVRDMYIGDEGTEIYIPIGNLNGSEVELLSVQEQSNHDYVNEGEWDVDRSRSEKAGKCGIVHKGSGGVEICWGVGSSGDHTYYTTYKVTNLLRGFADADGFNYMFVSPGIKPLPHYACVEIFKANVSNGNLEQLPLPADSVKAWAFRFYGEVQIEERSVKATTTEPFSSESAMIVMCRFEKGMFHPELETDSSFDTLKNKAFEGSDYGVDDSLSMSDIITILLFVFILFVIPVVVYIYKWWKKRKLKKALEKDLLWFREPPFKGDLKHSQMSLQKLSYKGVSTENLLGAYVLRMIYNGSLIIRDVRYPKTGKTGQLLGIGKEVETDKLNGKDVYLMSKLYDIFKRASGDDGILQPKELTRFMSSHAEQLETFATRINEETSINRISKEFDSTRDLLGFRKFLKEFTLSNERHAHEVTLWKEYLIFATLFGCADQVRKDMKQLNPEFFKLDKISQQLDANTIILPNYSAAAMNGTHRISHAIAQREAQARRSSGGGGFSSWGGGGGFSGGGGGGGVR